MKVYMSTVEKVKNTRLMVKNLQSLVSSLSIPERSFPEASILCFRFFFSLVLPFIFLNHKGMLFLEFSILDIFDFLLMKMKF